MTTMTIDPVRYPIGQFDWERPITSATRKADIAAIAAVPEVIRSAVHGLRDAQLDTSYREGGWTVRQVVHHIADSHMNAYVRYKLALTEVVPTIKPYDENRWAETIDGKTAPVEPSLALIDGLHARWAMVLNHMTDGDFAKTFYHPDHQREISLEVVSKPSREFAAFLANLNRGTRDGSSSRTGDRCTMGTHQALYAEVHAITAWRTPACG